MNEMEPPSVISGKPVSVAQYLNPLRMAAHLYGHKDLIARLAWRDTVERYRGSYLGVVWSFITPLLMLAVYALVLGVIFSIKWGAGQNEGFLDIGLTLFCGLILFNVFAESILRAPELILSNPNYVKKVIFPLEILPVAILCSSLVQAVISLTILIAALVLFKGTFSWTIYLFPLVALPLLMLTLGLSWFLSSLGVFVRDIGHPIGIVVQILLFISGIFFPLSAVPEAYRLFIQLNPLTVILENSRKTLMWGAYPDWEWMALIGLLSLIVLQLGYAWFMKTKRAFADVI
jgi:lipopolysaccharide transport system permease protein